MTAAPPAGGRVDWQRGLIRGVKVLGRESRNGRTYTPDCLARARRLYEGVSVRVDHRPADDEGDRPSESVFGQLKNVRVGADGLYADLEFLKSHPLAKRVAEAAERMPSAYGLSHDVSDWKGNTDAATGRYVVTEILEVESVDLVADPATTKGLFESHRKGKPMKTTTLKKWLRTQDQPIREAFRRLIEADAVAPGMSMLDTGTDPEAAVKSAFRSAVMAIVDDDRSDLKTTMSKLRSVLKSREDVLASGALTPTTIDDAPEDAPDDMGDDMGDDEPDGDEPDGDENLEEMDDADGDEDAYDFGGDDEDSEDEDDEEDKPMSESETVADLRAKLAEHERRDAVRNLCESHNVQPSPVLLKALAALDDETERLALLKESRRRNRRTGTVPADLEAVKDGASLAAALTAEPDTE